MVGAEDIPELPHGKMSFSWSSRMFGLEGTLRLIPVLPLSQVVPVLSNISLPGEKKICFSPCADVGISQDPVPMEKNLPEFSLLWAPPWGVGCDWSSLGL